MADEKSIVLKIETITDQSAMEAYGETLNKVLGSYEKNIEDIIDYNKQIKKNEEAIKAINKEGKKQGELFVTQIAEIRRLTAENGKLKQSKAELIQITKNQEKINASMSGTMQNQSQILGKLRMAWQKMTDEQKKANPEMLKTIQQLDQHLKDSDAEIGNFQRNVGNYKSAIDGLIEKFPILGGSISKVFGKVGVVGIALGVVNSFWKELKTTQDVGDALAIQQQAWTGVWQRFVRMIASADFSNFIQQLTDAYDASKKLAEVRDEMFEKENSIRLLKAKQAKEEQLLLMAMQNQTKTDQERIKAGNKYAELVMKNAKLVEQAYIGLAEAELDNLAKVTGADKEALRSYIENYADPKMAAKRKELKQYEALLAEEEALKAKNALLNTWTDENGVKIEVKGANALTEAEKARLTQIRSLLANTSEDVKKFAEIIRAYGKSADDAISTFVSAMERAYSAESNALASSKRAMNTVNSLTEQINNDRLREAERIEKEITEIQKKEWKEAEDALKEHLENMRREFGKENNGIFQWFKDIAAETEAELQKWASETAPMAENPISKWANMSPEDKKKLASQALDGAKQIFDSIANLSKEATQRRLNDELEAIDREAESEKAILEGKLEKGIISQKEYEKKLAELDEETAARKEEANKEAFEKQKRWNIAQAWMNAALAITKLFTESTAVNPATWVALGITAATTAAEIATIASQKYARGGELHGASHAQGGIKGFVGNQHIEAEGGEIIINKRSSAKHRNLLSLINSDNGWGDDFAKARGGSGRFFARGGVIGGYDFNTRPLPDSSGGLAKVVQQQTANINSAIDAINKRIDNLRVFVTVNDIEAKYNEKKVHLSRAAL